METVDHKCPSCTAPLPFNPEIQKWKCEYCGNEYTLEELEKYEKKSNNFENEVIEPHEKMDLDMYECSNCGAQILADENTTATFCVYCGNTAIIKNRLVGAMKPDKIIPFAYTKKQAEKSFIDYKKGKIFAPKDFNKKENIEKISGVYIPFWLYDCSAFGHIDVVGKNIKTWRSGDYLYTKTDTYKVLREGNMDYEKVPADGSKKFDDDLMDSIEPFDYSKFTDFNASYLSGFLSEKYDVGENEAFERAKERIVNSTKDELKSTVIGYSTDTIVNSKVDIDLKSTNYVLLPVWMLNIKYKGKLRKFAMNGQTGKMIGDVPISPLKVTFWSILIFVISFSILLLINLLLVGGIG